MPVPEFSHTPPYHPQEGFIELFDGGAGRTLLSGYEVVVFDDQSSRSLASFDLTNYTTSSSGFFVISSKDTADMVIAQVDNLSYIMSSYLGG